jgi:hypothetical protein
VDAKTGEPARNALHRDSSAAIARHVVVIVVHPTMMEKGRREYQVSKVYFQHAVDNHTALNSDQRQPQMWKWTTLVPAMTRRRSSEATQ